MTTEAELAEAIASVGPLFDTPAIEATNAATGETASEAADAIAEAVRAAEGGEPEAVVEADKPAPPPKEDPVSKRLALLSREKARTLAREQAIKEREATVEARGREIEAFQQRKAKAKDDPFAFLKAETGLEFEDLARSIIAKAEPPREATPDERAQAAIDRVEQLEKQIEQREMQVAHDNAVRAIKSEFAAISVSEATPTLASVVASPDALQALQAIGFGDPSDRAIEMIKEIYRHGGQAEIDGRVYAWPPRTELPVDVAARAVDNVLMRLLAPLRAGGSTLAKPTSAPKVAQAAEKNQPGQSATKPRTLSNTRASTPTSPVRESRSFVSDEDEIRDLARRFDVWKDG